VSVRGAPLVLATVAAFAAGGAAGCGTSAGAPPAPGIGIAVVDWTVGGSRDPAACGSMAVHVSLTDAAGAFVGEWAQECTAFAATLEATVEGTYSGLVEGTYTGQAVLLDATGNPRTTRVPMAPFVVVGGAAVVVAVDFPTTSFL
jgi:hypothetical protein